MKKTIRSSISFCFVIMMIFASSTLFAQSPLNGTYSINPSGSGDYLSFTLAVADLDSFGISGPVVFEVANGTYVENIIVDSINGSSSVNTVTFTSQTSNASNVTLSYTSTGYMNNYVVRLSGASNVFFEYLTFQNHGIAFSDVIYLYSINNIGFDNCVIISDEDASNAEAIVSFSAVNNFSLTNNRVMGGERNLELYNAGAFSQNVLIVGNEFIGGSVFSIEIWRVNDLTITDNFFDLKDSVMTAVSISCYEINGGKIKFNYILGDEFGPGIGLNLLKVKGTSAVPFEVSDNRFYLPKISTGIASVRNLNVHYVHNSIYGGGIGSYGFGVDIANDTNTLFRNNIIQLVGPDYGIGVNGNVGFQSGYNCISVPFGNVGYQWFVGGGNGTARATLSAWTAATGLDSNSINVSQIFSDTVELRVCADSLYQKGMFYPPSSIDFEGDVRQDPPCIGADEFILAPDLSMIADTVLCDGDTLNYTFNTGTVVWNTIDTVNSYYISTLGAQSVAVYGSCGSDTVNFDVLQQDYADISDTNLCEGEVAFFTSGVVNGTYQWSNGSNGQITLINSAQTLIVNVVDSSGCASSDVAFITQSTDVDLPDSAIFCSGNDVTLDANMVGVYSWNDGSTNQTLTVTNDGNYAVTVIDQNCTSIDSTYVTEVFNVIPSFTDSSDFFTVWFTNTSQNADSYSWNFGDGTTSTDVNPVHVFPYTTSNVDWYTVTLIGYNDCGDNEVINDEVRAGQLVSVSEIELATNISVYPNPNNGTFNLEVEMTNPSSCLIEVFDAQGKLVLTQNNEAKSTQKNNSIELINPTNGLYLIRVQTENEVLVKKITVFLTE